MRNVNIECLQTEILTLLLLHDFTSFKQNKPKHNKKLTDIIFVSQLVTI